MKIELNHIYNGDCLTLFKEMRDNSVDLIKADTDTLKKGEAIIYNEVKKANEKTLWNFFK